MRCCGKADHNLSIRLLSNDHPVRCCHRELQFNFRGYEWQIRHQGGWICPLTPHTFTSPLAPHDSRAAVAGFGVAGSCATDAQPAPQQNHTCAWRSRILISYLRLYCLSSVTFEEDLRGLRIAGSFPIYPEYNPPPKL